MNQDDMKSADGVALFSTNHPSSRWSFWRNLWWKLFPPDLHDDALEYVEIETDGTWGEQVNTNVFLSGVASPDATHTGDDARPPDPEPFNAAAVRRRLDGGDAARAR